VAGDPLIEFIGRGDRIEVNTFPDLPFSSYFSGNTVQICPVGALTAKPYRFRARPWDLEQVESSCTSCAVGCRVAVQSSGNHLTRYLGIDSEPVNHGWLCDKGRFDFEAVNSEDRLSTPMVRKGDQLVESTWGEALAAAAEGLNNIKTLHGPELIGVIGGARLANEDAYVWARVAKAVLGTDNVDAQLGDGLPAEVVLGLPRATIDQAAAAPALVLLCPDLKEELPVLYLRLRAAAVEKNVPIIELTPKRTGLSRYAAHSLAYRPGEAAALARALVDGTGGDVAGVPAAAIEAARQALAPGTVVVLGRPSVAESAASITEAAAILAGGLQDARFLPALRRANVHGALDMGLAPGVLPGRVNLDDGRAWFEAAWGSVPAERGLDTGQMLQHAADGRLQGLVLLGADPLHDYPDRTVARRGLSGVGFVLAVDTMLNDSVREHADVVLPAATYTERAGSTTNLEGRISRLSQKIVPPGVAWPDWMIGVELAARVGGNLPYESLEQVWDEIATLAPSHIGIDRLLLRERRYRDGIVAPLSEESLPPEPPPIDPEADPGILEVEDHGQPEMSPAPRPEPSEEPPAPPEVPMPPLLQFAAVPGQPQVPALDAYSLRLVSSHVLYDQGTIVQASPSLAHLAGPGRLHVNPHDLDRLGVATGGWVRMTWPRGSETIEVVSDTGVPRGSAWLPFDLAGPGAADIIDAGVPVNDVRIETV
jgi:NADH-quinone oxidoreductase subunit G